MFRSIEGIYKANRGLHTVRLYFHSLTAYLLYKSQKLKDISADPKSAGELGSLLIKWVRKRPLIVLHGDFPHLGISDRRPQETL